MKNEVYLLLIGMLVMCGVACIEGAAIVPTNPAHYSTMDVQNVLNAKMKHLQQVQADLKETVMGLDANDMYGKTSPMYAKYKERKSETRQELLGLVIELEYEINNFQKLLAEKQALAEMAASTILTTPQSVRFYQEIINQVREKPLKLLYKGSRDGFQAKQFHSKCDNQGATVTIIKADTGAIFGGYTNASWNASPSQFGYDKNAFLFSLVSNTGEERYRKLTQRAAVSLPGRSIYSNPSFGPTFGEGHDLHICNNAHENTGSLAYPTTYINLGKNYLVGVETKTWLVKDIEIYSL